MGQDGHPQQQQQTEEQLMISASRAGDVKRQRPPGHKDRTCAREVAPLRAPDRGVHTEKSGLRPKGPGLLSEVAFSFDFGVAFGK